MEKKDFETLVYETEKDIKKQKGKLFDGMLRYHFKPTPDTPFPEDLMNEFKIYRIASQNKLEYQRPSEEIDIQLKELGKRAKTRADKFWNTLG